MTETPPSDLVSFKITPDFGIDLHVGSWVVLLVIVCVLLLVAYRFVGRSSRISDMQIDGAQMGLGNLKLNFKPNDLDRQIAYSIWVELSTRKLGLPIDLKDDVILEVYDSWYAFFGITRNLIRDIPVSKARSDSTSKIIPLSIEVLNQGLRPHLTRWQARFRQWHSQNTEEKPSLSPQERQRQFPEFEALTEDLLKVNENIIAYRKQMRELAMS